MQGNINKIVIVNVKFILTFTITISAELKGELKMKAMSVVKGIAAGAAVGTVAYVLSSSSRRQKNSLKRDTGRTIRSFMIVLGDLSDML